MTASTDKTIYGDATGDGRTSRTQRQHAPVIEFQATLLHEDRRHVYGVAAVLRDTCGPDAVTA
ncbi:hypothetical protein ACWEQ2_38235 [Streptomyces sp. NPDC004096]